MGSSRTSAGRVSAILRGAIWTWKDVSRGRNCSRSTSLVSLESVDVWGDTHRVRHAPMLRTIPAGSVTVGEDKVLCMCGSFCQNLNKPVDHDPLWASPRIETSFSGRQFVRKISLQASRKLAHDVIVKDGDLKDDDNMSPGQHDGEPTSELSLEKTDEKNSERNVLFKKLENCSRKCQTVTQILLHISKGHNFTKEDATIIILKFRRYRRYMQAAEVSDWIAETKMFDWTPYDHVVRLGLKGKLGLSSEVEKLFNDSPPELQTETAYNSVIKHFCEKGMVKKANEWLERLIKAGGITHPFAFNRLLGLYKDRSMGGKVNAVLEAMNAVGISKDIYTYNILMSMKAKHKDIAGIEKIFDECKADSKVKVDPSTYATLAVAYIGAGLTDKAVAALEEAEKLDFSRTGNVDEVIATLWAKFENKEKVLRSWETMKTKDIVAARTYIVMIETFGQLGMVDRAEILFHELHQTKGKVQPRQFTALLSAYANNNMFDRAEDFVGGMKAFDLKRTASLNHHIIVSYLKMGRLDKALAIANEAKWKGGFPVWFTTMLVLLNAAAEKGDVITAEKIFENLVTTYSHKNHSVYITLLKAYSKACIPVDGVLQRMEDVGFTHKETVKLLQQCAVNSTSSICTSEDVPATVASPVL